MASFDPAPSAELLEEARKAIDNPHELIAILRLFFFSFQPPSSSSIRLIRRLELFDIGVWDVLLPLTERYVDIDDVQLWIWQILRDTICVFDNEDPAEFETVQRAVDKGAIEAIVKELKRRPTRFNVLFNVISSLTTICLDSRYVDRVIECGAIEACLQYTGEGVSFDYATSALGSLKNLSITKRARPYLIKSGALEVARRSLRHLSGESPSELKYGLCSASLICRLMEEHDTGVLAEVVAETNGLLFVQLHWLLNAVLKQGPVVLGSGWNAANIIMDISMWSSCDENKRFMVDFIHPLVLGLNTRGLRNVRLVQYGFEALLNIGLAPESRQEMLRVRKSLINFTNGILMTDNSVISIHIRQCAWALRQMVAQLHDEDEGVGLTSSLQMDQVD